MAKIAQQAAPEKRRPGRPPGSGKKQQQAARITPAAPAKKPRAKPEATPELTQESREAQELASAVSFQHWLQSEPNPPTIVVLDYSAQERSYVLMGVKFGTARAALAGLYVRVTSVSEKPVVRFSENPGGSFMLSSDVRFSGASSPGDLAFSERYVADCPVVCLATPAVFAQCVLSNAIQTPDLNTGFAKMFGLLPLEDAPPPAAKKAVVSEKLAPAPVVDDEEEDEEEGADYPPEEEAVDTDGDAAELENEEEEEAEEEEEEEDAYTEAELRSMSTEDLRNVLSQSGISVGAKASREQLLQLALQAGTDDEEEDAE